MIVQSAGKMTVFCVAEDFGTEEEMFLGSPVPAKLLHRDLKCIRNCVDLLLDDIDYTDPVVERYFHSISPTSIKR